MAYPNQNRLSNYSNASVPPPRGPLSNTSQQVSTTTLLNSLHTAHSSGQPYILEASTSLAVNTWTTVANGGVVDAELGRKAWEHARRRAEDGCIVLGHLHESSPSLFQPFCETLPISIPHSFYTALAVVKAFTHCVTPQNPSLPRYSALAATFTMNLAGVITGASLVLSASGLDTQRGLVNVPAEAGHRAFDVFYWLMPSSASPAERDALSLKPLAQYALLARSGTLDPPSFVPTADDAASAEDLREQLKALGIKGADLRNVISALAAILKLGDSLGFLVDEEILREVCEDVGTLLDVNPQVLRKKFDTMEREELVAGLYEALLDWVVARANEAIRSEVRGAGKAARSLRGSDGHQSGIATPQDSDDDGDTVSITVVEVPGQSLGKAASMKTVFDDSEGINNEMREDGVPVAAAGSSVIREMRAAISDCEPELGIMAGPAGRELEQARDRREGILERIGRESESDSFVKEMLYPVDGEGILLGKVGRFDLVSILSSSRVWFHLSLHPTDELPAALARAPAGTTSWSAGAVSRQLRAWRLPEWANRRNKNLDFTADFDIEEFVTRYSRLGCQDGRDGVESWILERGWSNGEVVIGRERVWIREGAWWEAETMLDMKPADSIHPGSMLGGMVGAGGMESGYSAQSPGVGSGFFNHPQYGDAASLQGSRDNLLQRQQSSATMGGRSGLGGKSLAPAQAPTLRSATKGDYGLGTKGDEHKHDISYYAELDPELGDPKVVTEQPITRTRRIWVAIVWALTFWIPSFMLRYIGRMKRPDVRMAWREKFVLITAIFMINAILIFYFIAFGRLLCPNWDKAWNAKEVSSHQGSNDYWVSHHGKVYDLSHFWKLQHSDTAIETTQDVMQPFAGLNMDEYMVPPLTRACPRLVTDESILLIANNTVEYPNGIHRSGPRYQADTTTVLNKITWYEEKFLPRMNEYYKGALVVDKGKVKFEGENWSHMWIIINEKIYDFTDYFHTLESNDNVPGYHFLDTAFEELVKNNPGTDITHEFENSFNSTTYLSHKQCLDNFFYVGETDFRKTARCQVNNYMLLAFSIILCTVIVVKFLAALQLGSKRRPAAQDKFVICQVPAYTEGEDQLRKGLDSLTALAYDNKRKLICVICDGMIVGGGNDRPTPKIVLDILGVDPKVDPPALPFKSVGQGSEQLNYGKVYSGLYEYEGNVVPYIVVVKVGKESEQSKAKPGNRGKRDSQILLMSFLNRVHHRSPMSPLELEMFHQINNIIGVDPELYEYLLMVDADTMVKEDALNRLVASCANDAKIAGICGETSLENEERSWWTMIQVYEYYISHHLAKAFESLFGSVTCLPGCFCMYRLRTADKGRPLIVSDKVITDYSDCDVDTLHKKNLLSLGEDRYLTTLMTKHFPQMSYKFIPDAYALTAAPETWSILLSQRRRWINSTIHNLFELVFLKDLCGFCCFSMRFVVFVDLFGTIILPATCAYLGYLIYNVATRQGQFPLISIIMLAAVYGLQAIIFIIKRQWQHIGWMIIYIIAFPIYSFILPIYSFWKQDDFSWGNTRIVIGEKGTKQVVAMEEDEGFDPRSIPLQRWDDYATANGLPGRRGMPNPVEKGGATSYEDGVYEMDDMQSVYSSVKPASTILTGFPHQGPPHMPPQSPIPFQNMQQRQSGYSGYSRYTDNPQDGRLMSMGARSEVAYQNPYGQPAFRSSDNLTAMQGVNVPRQRSPLGYSSRPHSTVNFQNMISGPSDAEIIEAIRACLRDVDLDQVSKKTMKALVEQRLQTQLSPDRRSYLDQQIDIELANM